MLQYTNSNIKFNQLIRGYDTAISKYQHLIIHHLPSFMYSNQKSVKHGFPSFTGYAVFFLAGPPDEELN